MTTTEQGAELTVADAMHPWPPLDTSRNQLVLCVGRKGSGKSVFARALFRHWPDVDKVTIDVNGDAEPGEDATKITTEPPAKLPARREPDEPLNLHYIANPASPTYRDDLDRAIRLALFPQDRPTLLWVDEIGEVTQANHTPPHLRVLLQQSRHYHASALMCGPRPVDIDKLCIAQADRVVVFDVPQQSDRKRIAECIGWPLADFEDAFLELKRAPKFSFLMYVAEEHALYLCPPLPTAWLA